MGCGETLELDGARIHCQDFACPNPEAAHLILDNPHIENHEVLVSEFDFTIKHPLSERIEDELFECPLHSHLTSLGGAPVALGHYHVYQVTTTLNGEPWTYWAYEPI